MPNESTLKMSLRGRGITGKRASWLTAYGFLLPALLLFCFFELYSLIYNIFMGFHDWNGFREPVFVGLENYRNLVSDKFFLRAFGHNTVFVLVALGIMTLLALLLAVILDSGIPGAAIFRALFFVPVIIPTVVAGLAWTRVYSTQGGLLNHTLEFIGLETWQRDWLGDPGTALAAILVVWVWRHLGYGVMMFSAALLGIPSELKEAPLLDGASQMQVVTRIMIPLILPFFFVVALLYTIFSFKVFTLVYIMTGGGPYGATEVINTYLYDTVFTYSELGLGSAMANVSILIILVFGLIRSMFKPVEY